MKANKKLTTELRDYLMISIAMVCYCIGWTVFLLPNNITTGGVPGVSSVIYWGFGIPYRSLTSLSTLFSFYSIENLRMAFLRKDYRCRTFAHDTDNIRPEQFRRASPSQGPAVYGKYHRCHLLRKWCRYGLSFQWLHRWHGYYCSHRAQVS